MPPFEVALARTVREYAYVVVDAPSGDEAVKAVQDRLAGTIDAVDFVNTIAWELDGPDDAGEVVDWIELRNSHHHAALTVQAPRPVVAPSLRVSEGL